VSGNSPLDDPNMVLQSVVTLVEQPPGNKVDISSARIMRLSAEQAIADVEAAGGSVETSQLLVPLSQEVWLVELPGEFAGLPPQPTASAPKSGKAFVIVSIATGANAHVGIVYTTRGQPEPPPSAASLSGRIHYLSPTNRVIRPAAELQSEGIRTYADSAAFLQAVETTPDAVIMIDRDFANQLDSNWLRQQYDQGKVLIGVGVNLGEPADRLGLEVTSVEGASPISYPSDRTFYAAVVKGEGCQGAATDHLDVDPYAQFRLLLRRLESMAECGASRLGEADR
jgi:hypothetical protein